MKISEKTKFVEKAYLGQKSKMNLSINNTNHINHLEWLDYVTATSCRMNSMMSQLISQMKIGKKGDISHEYTIGQRVKAWSESRIQKSAVRVFNKKNNILQYKRSLVIQPKGSSFKCTNTMFQKMIFVVSWTHANIFLGGNKFDAFQAHAFFYGNFRYLASLKVHNGVGLSKVDNHRQLHDFWHNLLIESKAIRKQK